MRILSIIPRPELDVPFLNAGKGPGAFYVDKVEVFTAIVDGLPSELDALVATADLQGREQLNNRSPHPPRLLGEVLPSHLAEEILPDLGLDANRTGVLLAGDFYTVPLLDMRGGTGDVTEVWRCFGDRFKWVAGVAGNHDLFGTTAQPASRLGRKLHYLDATTVTLDGLRIAGLGGIIGNPRKPHRRTDQDYLFAMKSLLEGSPDIVITHDGPDSPDDGYCGLPLVRQWLESQPATLVIRGHAHWNQPLAELANGTQVLNVECRVVVMRCP